MITSAAQARPAKTVNAVPPARTNRSMRVFIIASLWSLTIRRNGRTDFIFDSLPVLNVRLARCLRLSLEERSVRVEETNSGQLRGDVGTFVYPLMDASTVPTRRSSSTASRRVLRAIRAVEREDRVRMTGKNPLGGRSFGSSVKRRP